ncbi:uncharacterized protein LOC126577254 [Anopheles aquasalis]|uniref:uncharacterized protein LOC126577254 n=1 Tax=Anopheles aquasalis TaxID=42839 RepID=UPI00215A5B1F|nr:uncharacterized protein LOC126577254 [Anopheles aquasalis]
MEIALDGSTAPNLRRKSPYLSMAQEKTLEFIETVQQYPSLWMERKRGHRVPKNEAWARIAAEFQQPVEVLKKRWRNLTIQFCANRKNYYSMLAQNRSVDPPVWFAYEAMCFLNEGSRFPKPEVYNEINEMHQSEESSMEHMSPSPPAILPVLSPPATTSSQHQAGPSRKRMNTFQETDLADTLTSLERSLEQVVAVVSKRNKYEGIGQFVADTLAENDGSRIGNAELCSKFFSICALATKKSPRDDIIRGITDRLQQCDDDKFESIKSIIENLLEDDQCHE